MLEHLSRSAVQPPQIGTSRPNATSTAPMTASTANGTRCALTQATTFTPPPYPVIERLGW